MQRVGLQFTYRHTVYNSIQCNSMLESVSIFTYCLIRTRYVLVFVNCVEGNPVNWMVIR